jgi:hypothetical protein
MVQTANGTAAAVAGGRKGREDIPSLLACLVLVGISWVMVVCNIIINIRNGQRLSIDDHGWLMNGAIVGTLSLAPTAAMGFSGYRWKRDGRGLATLAALVAVPLVIFNLWSASEYVGDQMLGRQQLQEQRFTSDQHVAEMSNAEIIRSKREAEATLWKAWGTTKDPAERARIEKQIEKIRAETPKLRAALEAGTAGARADWISKHIGWSKEAIEGVTPMAVPALMQLVELVFSFLGFSAWPRKQAIDRPIEFNEFRVEFSMEDARRDIVRLRGTGELDTMKLSKAAFAKRWGVPRSTAWMWLQKFQADGLIETVPTGTRNVTAIRARVVPNRSISEQTKLVNGP